MQAKGYGRRDFLQFCTFAAGVAGLAPSALGQVVESFQRKPRPPVIWLHFQECTCCSESFIRSSHPIVADVLLDVLSLDYTETLQAAAGAQAEQCMHDTIKNHPGEYILLVCQADRDRMLRNVARSSHGTCRISTADVAAFSIPLPPLSEQLRIVAKVDQLMTICDDLESKLTQSQTDSEKLMEAVVHQLLNGKT